MYEGSRGINAMLKPLELEEYISTILSKFKTVKTLVKVIDAHLYRSL